MRAHPVTMPIRLQAQEPLNSTSAKCTRRSCLLGASAKESARHGMAYTVRFAFERDGEIFAPPFVTYVSHDTPGEVRNATATP